MKALGGILAYLTGSLRGRNLRVVAWIVATLVLLVAIYSGVFHVLMEREGRSHSISTGAYWTLATMSTLGFGDITFNSDAGQIGRAHVRTPVTNGHLVCRRPLANQTRT